LRTDPSTDFLLRIPSSLHRPSSITASLGCIILALEVIFDGAQPAASEYRRLIAGALVRLEKFAKISVSGSHPPQIVKR